MEPSIDERLSLAEENFLLAAAEGGPSLEVFHDNWLALLQDIDHAIRTASIKDETLAQADAVSSGIAVFTEQIMDFNSSADAVKHDLEDVFAQFDINDSARVESPARAISEDLPGHPELPTVTLHSSHPSYIEPAYQWLLNNLHNPYPSRAIRIDIAREVGSDAKCIDSWFIDVRKRIGWNALRRQYFSNKRVDIVDAAMRFFVQEDERRPLDPLVESEFAGIKKSAKDLYADRFERSTLATKLDVAVKDLTPMTKAQARAEQARRRHEKSQLDEDVLAASSYPSPQRSPGRSPEHLGLVPLEEDEDLATTHLKAIAGRKRRSATPDKDETFADRPYKRTRLGTPSPANGLPSPTPSSHEPLRRSISPPAASNSMPLPTISRKRRLSDADGQGAPKRPRNLPIGPRMQAVSDPLPIASALFEASSMNDWFNAHFGIPNPVVVDALDMGEALDLEVFDYSVFADTPSTVSESLSRESCSPRSVGDDVPALMADEAPFAAEALDISTNTFDINDLFLDYEEPEAQFLGHNFVNQPQDMSMLAPQAPLLDFSSLTGLPTIPFTSSYDTTYSTEATHSLSLDPSSTYNWFFNPPFDSSQGHFSPVNMLQDYGQSILPQVPSLNISNHMGAFPAKPGAEDKADIQQQLAAMKEAMRRLEEKLAASS
ncbi:hypothetical protein D9615_001304 [Tricholomella constricta]|uniref:Homeodomain mating-type protein n=1 Tax=Tricholomella constricta TaxID=117010 RepID=A0A8H5M987_9AGAR|nr:hypothetical protein D9615_001304 [Tricholomella constricta]